MKVRETIGTSIRTMLNMTTDGYQHQDMEVTTDGYQHQDMVNVTTEVWERG